MFPTRIAAVTVLTIASLTGCAHAQQGDGGGLPLIGVEVDLDDFGIEGAESVTRGRVSIVYDPAGTRLAMYFLRDTPIPPRRTPPTPPDTSPIDAPPRGEENRALWVWSTAEILRQPGEREPFLDFIEAQGITRVFLYLPAAEGERPSRGYIPFDSDEMGPLLADLRARGALTYALDGDKDYVLEENHPGIYRTVERMVEHNRSVPPEQRFHGVRYDIEPYLVPGFQGPKRDLLLDGYVELIAGVKERAGDDLAVAVDVPLWFDAPDEESGELMMATFDGERRPILEHIMAIVDDIAIMNYRTSAEGPNGALAHAQGELALGKQADIPVFIGVETVLLIDEDLQTFFGPPTEGLPTHAEARWVVLEGLPESRARVWVVDSEAALAELAGKIEGDLVRHWPAGRPARVSSDAQSFYNLGADSMWQVTETIVDNLSRREAFAGLAFHDYLGMRRLVKGH